MIAHSLPRDFFGPASGLHGATYVVDAEFRREELDENNVVIDIGAATEIVADVLAQLNYKNLDTLAQFKEILTTTEYLARYLHGEIADQVREKQGFKGGLKVTLNESHIAWAGYDAIV